MIRALIALALLAGLPAGLAALELPAGARQITERDSALDSYDLPTAPADAAGLPARRFEGRVLRRVWRLDSGAATTLQLLAPMRAELVAEGYDIVFECADRGCGGFDFRFRTEVVPAPDMHVNLRDFRFLSATRGPEEALSLLVSRSRATSHIQIITVTPPGGTAPGPAPAGAAPEDAPGAIGAPVVPVAPAGAAGAETLAARLVAEGHVVLADLDFGSGSTRLNGGPYASLAALADFLAANPEYRIALVGHTDTVGALEANIALSRRRAEAVRDRLIADHGVAPDRVSARGMGYLAPVASNLHREGREANRRVEAILLPGS